MKYKILFIFIIILITCFSSDTTLPGEKRSFRFPERTHNGAVPLPKPAAAENEQGNRIVKLFNGDLVNMWIRQVPEGDIRDIAVKGRYVFLLIKRFNKVLDVLFVYDKTTGKLIRIWGIGRFNSFAMASTEGGVWIATRSSSHFLRKISTYGKWVHTVPSGALPEGDLRGLGIHKGAFIFASYKGGISTFYRFTPETRRFSRMFQIHGEIQSITVKDNRLYAYRNEFFNYASHWVYVYDLVSGKHRIMRFINEPATGMDRDDGNIYCLNHDSSSIHIFPFRVLEDKGLILANPIRRKITVTYTVANRSRVPYRGELWLAYPGDDRCQAVENLYVTPRPAKTATDSFGNRWALVRWNSSANRATVTMGFTATSVSAGQTIDHSYEFKSDDVPPKIMKRNTSETHCYDLSHYVIQSQSTNVVLDGSHLSNIIAIRNYVNNTLREDGPDYGSSKSSFFLYKGYGQVYGHSLSFAALSRVNNIPARSIGGIYLARGDSEDTVGSHVWNQVYFPGCGWVHVDSHKDDNTVGGHSYDHIGLRSNRYIVTFTGDFDKKDYQAVFAENNWYYEFTWKGHGGRAKNGPVVEKITMDETYIH